MNIYLILMNMIEYKIIKLNNKALPILGKDNWIMC
jgi:hypothetical protein